MADDITPEEREAERLFLLMQKDTDVEVFKYGVNGKDVEEDENDGDDSLEQQDDPLGIDEPATPESVQEASADDSEAEEPEAEEPQGDEVEGEPGPQQYERETHVPSIRLRAEADARRAAEREATEWRARYDELQRSARPPQPAAPPPPKPDQFAEPEAHEQWMEQQITQKIRQQFAQASLAEARSRHGAEFQYAYDLIDKNPQFAQEAQEVLASINPGETIMRIAEPYLAEFREQRQQQELAEQQDWAARNGYRLVPERAGGPSNSRPQTQLRNNPPSLNGASGGGSTRQRLDPRGMDGSEDAIFREAFTPLR